MLSALVVVSMLIQHWRLVLFVIVLSVACSVMRTNMPVAPPAAASAAATADIPPEALKDYQDAVARGCPGLSWTVLAGIGKVESDHGRSRLPGVHSGANFAGAMGPMQFLSGTWAKYGQGNVYDHRDASFAAARLLCADGASSPSRVPVAIYSYNHDWSYVATVQDWAARYAACGRCA